MAIDSRRVKQFWDDRASRYQRLPFESIANLEQDPNNLKLKIELETAKVFEFVGPVAGKRILDLGAGVGQWAFRFVERGAQSITAVEYSADLAEIGRKEASQRGTTNLEFVVSPAEDFRSPGDVYEIVFISGLFVYMNDDQAERLTSHLHEFCGAQTLVLLRDGTALAERFEINDRHSDHLLTTYSATYRTRSEYVELFDRHGFSLIRDENMFEEGCPLNKYPETRLRIYTFRPAKCG